MSELAETLFARGDQRLSDPFAPVIRVDVNREELTVGARVTSRADRDEADDFSRHFRHQRGSPAEHLGAVVDGQPCQALRRQRMGICCLPRLHVNARDGLRVVGCSGADHRAEPTLPA